MGTNISIYLSDEALAKLDDAVAKQAAKDRADGLSGRKVASRSSVLERLIIEGIEGNGVLDRKTIEYFAVSLAKKYGAKEVSLFGSYARNEARADSDVDILLDKGAIRGMGVLDFQDELSALLNKSVDVVTTVGASERFLKKIQREKVVLYEAG
ncbi:MAG: nucleotidyltransferase domain-containing protein [Eggerthellaceae bacterium]|nr:nucleotidyltransferase domain-containing protein [Eggerthellaceae bacterium]